MTIYKYFKKIVSSKKTDYRKNSNFKWFSKLNFNYFDW